MNVSIEDLIQAMSGVLRCPAVASDSGDYTFNFSRYQPEPLDAAYLRSLIEGLTSHTELDDNSIITKTSFEVLVQRNRRTPMRIGPEDLSLDDPHSGLSYKLGTPSDTYICYLCLKLTEGANHRQMRFGPSPMMLDRAQRESGSFSVFDLLRLVLRSWTLTIRSDTPQTRIAWKHYSEAFFFHMAYSLDMPLMPDRNLTELVRPARISGMRRARIADLVAPQRHYAADLVYHYQLGVSAESPMLEYISYYHVAEHWFESIYQDDLVEQVQLAITSPAFSYKRKKDLRDLIRKISRAVQLRDDQLVINELVALRLTLTRYVEIGQLASDLQAFDDTLLDYYSEQVVSFCGGDTVSFRGSEPSDVLKALSSRIYKTRNALVHSKEGLKGRFIPFTNDRDLLPEIPLIRFIAEQIIMATSSIPG